MNQSGLMLLNIDKPLKKATLHNVHCSFVTKPYGTKLKPASRLGKEGGWFEVTSEVAAIQVAAKEMPTATFLRCPRCT